MHIASTALHYGQSCFEGLKAFRGQDDVVRIFRPDENAKRMEASAERLVIPPVPKELFLQTVHMAVRENIDYVPPYGSGGSLYIRPLLYGSGAKIGLQSSDEFTFLVMVVPVGDYYKGGLSPVTALVMQNYDRAAPNGVGHVKVAGNYAADLMPNLMGKSAGYPINLYLDAQNRRTIEEFGTSNFFGLKGNTYVTPNSASVLPSITNKTLMQLAQDGGMVVEQREIDIDELEEFDEVGACGTAVVITAVTRVVHGSRMYEIGADPDRVGERLERLYNKVRAIQYGEQLDLHGWAQPLLM
ncbi:branched chain amino acid aminotransferase [Gracilaria domingensis]|nr:branched chain amino acid aminotransferase [Gracilaria domingensis]